VVDASLAHLIPRSSNYTWVPAVDTVRQLTSSAYATFKAGQSYISSSFWYDTGYGVVPLAIESTIQGVETLITSESMDILSTQPVLNGGVTNGLGLYASTQSQAVFIKG
jgi:hypothetical protein